MTTKLDTVWTPNGTTYALGNTVIAEAQYIGNGQYKVAAMPRIVEELELHGARVECRNLESAEYYILHIACEYKARMESIGIDETHLD